MKIRQHFRDHLFIYPIVLAVVVMSVFSYYRFIVKNDYLVYYEGVCDPYTKSCFKSCDNDKCTYYMKVQKYAPDVYAECGKDVTNCKLANACLYNDQQCLITYCDAAKKEDCAVLTEVVSSAPSDGSNIIETK